MSFYDFRRIFPGMGDLLPTTISGNKHKVEPLFFGLTRKQLPLIILVVQNSTLVVLMRYSRIVQKVGQPMYIASTAVFLAELLKIVACLAVMRYQQPSWHHFVGFIRTEILGRPRDTLKMIVPSGLYALQNNLLYVALSNLEAATFQVTYQMKILSTAVFSVVLLGRSLQRDKWMALVMLMIGVTLVQSQNMATSVTTTPVLPLQQTTIPAIPLQQPGTADDTSEHLLVHTLMGDDIGTILTAQSPFIGLMAVVTSCISSGLAGCFFEKILKTSDTSMWVRNIQLGISDAFFSLVGMLLYDMQSICEGGLLQGYDGLTWIVVVNQALGGLLVAIVVKFADNILKGFATSLSIIVSGVIGFYLFNFQPPLIFVTGACIVMISSYLYGVDFTKKLVLVQPH